MIDKKHNQRLEFSSRCVHGGQEPDPLTGAVSVPIYANSTYAQESPGVHKGYVYARGNNPTRYAFERCVADLEDGTHGFAFASGLAATCAVLDLLPHGAHIIACDDLYGGSYRLFERVKKDATNISVSYVDMSQSGAIEKAITPQTKMIWVETPTNPLLKIADLEMIAGLAQKKKILSVCDNTFATPYLQRPLTLGFDVVLHSVSKYIGGHSDVIGGTLICNDDELAQRLRFTQNAVGAIMAPWDSFLLLRSTKTLHVRVQRHCENAAKIADFLAQQTQIERVVYPGREDHHQAHEQVELLFVAKGPVCRDEQHPV